MEIFDLGTRSYEETLSFQAGLLEKRISGEVSDALILVEHPAVVTLGRLSDEASVHGKRFFEEKGIPVIRAGRGGKVTFHAPGQLVMYPIVDLAEKRKDISGYIDLLESTVAGSLQALGVRACREAGKRGVWVDGKKIAFTGIAIKHWVSYHGVAVNVNNDIEAFGHMHPCGDSGIKVTSAKKILGRDLDMRSVKELFARRFEEDLENEYAMSDKSRVEA